MSDSLRGWLVGSLIVCALFIAVPGGWFLAESAWTVRQARPHLVQTLTDTNRAVIAVGAAAGNVEKASRQWQSTQEQLAKDSGAALTQTKTTLVTLQNAVKRMDVALNNSLMPLLVSTIKSQNASLSETQRQVQSTLGKLGTTADALTSTAEAVDRRISDPNIDAVTANLAATTAHASEATQNLNGMAQDGRDVADYFKAELLKPLAVWRKIVDFILDKGYKARAYYP